MKRFDTSNNQLDTKSEKPLATPENSAALYDPKDVQRQIDSNSFFDENLTSTLEQLNVEGANYRELFISNLTQVNKMKELFKNYPNLKEPLEILYGSAVLSHATKTPLCFPPLLIQGPPGCGKTDLVNTIAGVCNIDLRTINMGSIHGNFELPGGHRSWRAATTGLLIKNLLESRYANPIYLFDEVELGDPDNYQPLLQFLEEDTFNDHFLEISFNTKYINIIFVTNDKSLLSPALRSRVIEFDVDQPNDQAKKQIVKAIYKKLRSNHKKFTIYDEDLSETLIERISKGSLRDARKNLEIALYRSACRNVKKSQLTITEKDLPIQRRTRRMGFI